MNRLLRSGRMNNFIMYKLETILTKELLVYRYKKIPVCLDWVARRCSIVLNLNYS